MHINFKRIADSYIVVIVFPLPKYHLKKLGVWIDWLLFDSSLKTFS